MCSSLYKLKRDFYIRPTLEVARELLGCILIHHTADGVTAGKIVEVEAYIGPDDAAAHSYNNRPSTRTMIQYGIGGHAYIYLIYGMHYCMNVVTGEKGKPESILIRALEPTMGIAYMKQRRHTEKTGNLCNGPGKLCAALKIDKTCYGEDLCGNKLYIVQEGKPLSRDDIIADKRINVAYAGKAKDYEWRFLIRNNPFVSVKPKR